MDQPEKAMIIKAKGMYIPCACRAFQVLESLIATAHNDYQVRKNE